MSNYRKYNWSDDEKNNFSNVVDYVYRSTILFAKQNMG